MHVPFRLLVQIALFALKHHRQVGGALSATTAAGPGVLVAAQAWAPLIGEWIDANPGVTSPGDQVEGFLTSIDPTTEKLTPEEKSSINDDMAAAMERQSRGDNTGQNSATSSIP